jgi:hypothetical protein
LSNKILKSRHWFRFRECVIVIAAALIGCGPAGPLIVPVSGTLSFDGREPPEVCRLTFVPQADSSDRVRPSGAQVGADGEVQVTEFRGVRGLFPGEYTIRVSYYDLKPGGNRKNENDWIKHQFVAPEPLLVDPGASHVSCDIVVPKNQK